MVSVVQFPHSRFQRFAGELRPVTLAIGLAFGLGVAPAASAGIITVNNLLGTSVPGQCTLRDAIAAANTDAVVQGCAAGSAADTINFSVSGTIALATPIQINSAVTINGTGITLAPSGAQSALYIGGAGNPAVTISGVTFQGNGTTTTGGAAIYHYGGTLTIQNCVFTGNGTTNDGGALYSGSGNVIIQSSTFTGNHAGQRGGAIFMYTGTLSIDQSTLSGNTAGNDGGAIAFYSDGGTPGVLVITNSTLSGNSTTGVNHHGGAIFMYSGAASAITNSTISGNSAAGHGGGIYLENSAPMTVDNSTITGNTATSGGGGVYLYGTTLNLNSTIIAGNADNDNGPDIFDPSGTTVNADHSLIQDQTGWVNNVGSANVIGQNPLLGPLANNGGPTLTHALLAGSPAIDTGSNPLALAFDQRGTGFARTGGALTDIGAFEIQAGLPPPTVTINQGAAQADPTSNAPIVFDVVFSQPVSGFTATDPILSGTAGATTVTVTGSGAIYTVSVSGMTASGTVIVTIPANAAVNGASAGNLASTSTDNTVTFNLLAPPPTAALPVPTLSTWGVGLLSVLMAGWAMLTGFGRRRRS